MDSSAQPAMTGKLPGELSALRSNVDPMEELPFPSRWVGLNSTGRANDELEMLFANNKL